MEGNQDNDRPGFFGFLFFPTAVEQEVANRFNVSPDIAVPLAVRENKPGVLKQLIQEGNPIHTQDIHGWTALHHAALLGHSECARILLKEETCNIDVKAKDGSTPLTVACANLPTSKECVKVLCEYKANPNLASKMFPGDYGQSKETALLTAIEAMPDLEVIQWLVRGGADVEKYVQIWEDGAGDLTWGRELSIEMSRDLMMCLFKGELRQLWANPIHPAYDFNADYFVRPLRPDVSEVAEIAMYLAKHGAVRHGYALAAVLFSFRGGYILTPQSLNEVVECFLENGAVLNTADILDQEYYVWRPSVLFLFARKSIIFLEGVPTSRFCDDSPSLNALTVLAIKGQVSGILPFCDVKELHDNLEYRLAMPNNFRPLEMLYAMTKSPPSLRQLARTKIRSQVAECGKFCRENLKKLPDIPEILIDYVQLADLDQILIRYRSEFEEIFELA